MATALVGGAILTPYIEIPAISIPTIRYGAPVVTTAVASVVTAVKEFFDDDDKEK